MSIILPILFAVVGVGLFAPRMTARWWIFLACWILFVLVYNYLKPPPVPAPVSAAASRPSQLA